MKYILINLVICAGYVLSTGVLRSKYYEDIRHKGLEKSSSALCLLVLVLSMVYALFLQGESSAVQMVFFEVIYACELVALGYACCVIRELSFNYKRQKNIALGVLFFTVFIALIQAGNFVNYWL
ncbi:MAG: hypothetical protein IJ660_02520 [Alphaproteobacteria bacterium]|nr:hypothetical protein [Alphaproteobacteria bacterium]